MKTGIGDIGIYIPPMYIDIDEIAEKREGMTPRLSGRISHSAHITHQKSIRFPRGWEDPVTLSAEAGRQILDRNPEEGGRLRYIGSGTETSVDASKPVASYVHGLWQRSGYDLPPNLSTFQSQHACASGTIALMGTAAQLSLQRREDETGMVLCTDIARYERNTTAEITQGAGSVALLVESNPRLVEIDPAAQGFSSRDVDDFFRPHESRTARVRGQYSMKCYQDSLIEAADDYCRRIGTPAEQVLRDTDYFIFHTPFASMSALALRHLFEVKTGRSPEENDARFRMTSLEESSASIASVGNIYSGAIYLNLAVTLYHEWKRFGEQIIGRKILFASYGSGNTMIVFPGTIAPGAGDVLSRWDLSSLFDNRVHAEFPVYEEWASQKADDGRAYAVDPEQIPRGRYYLSGVRSDGFREYDVKG